MFYESSIVDFEEPTVYVQSRTLSENVPKALKPVAFLVAFHIIHTFSETGHGKQKNFKM